MIRKGEIRVPNVPKETLVPDVRFGITFLDEQYDLKAARGEVLIDKIDAELFLKRPADNKIISFMRRNTYLYETINELNVQLQNAIRYTFPEEDSMYLSMLFHMRYIRERNETNILLGDIIFNKNDLNPNRQIEFYVSPRSNGFFIRAKTRDNDRKSTSFLNFEYNRLERSGEVQRPSEYNNMSYWRNGNAILEYTVETTGTSTVTGKETTVTCSDTVSIRLIEHTLVEFPERYNLNLTNITRCVVRVNAFRFPKLQYMYAYYMALPKDPSYPFHQLIEVDYAAYIKDVEVWSFVDEKNDIPAYNENMFVNQILDSAYLMEFMQKLKHIGDGNGVIPSVTRPSATFWTANNAWAEMIREVRFGNAQTRLSCETSIEALEKFLYYYRYINTEFTFDEDYDEGLLIIPIDS